MSKAGEAESTLILPEAQCPSPKPLHQEPCGLNDCGPSWRVEQVFSNFLCNDIITEKFSGHHVVYHAILENNVE